MSTQKLVCRQCGQPFHPSDNNPEACRFHPGDYQEGSGVENYEPSYWDCKGGEDKCMERGRHVAKGTRDPAVPTVKLSVGEEHLVLQQPSFRIGAHPRSDWVVRGSHGEYSYFRFWWKEDELWAKGLGSLEWFQLNGKSLETRKPTRLTSGDRLEIQTGPVPFVVSLSF